MIANHGIRLAALALLACAAVAVAADGFEEPPALALADAAPTELQHGLGFSVDASVPTDGLTTVFTLRTDSGTQRVLGVESLRGREAEIPALQALREASKTETFVKALGSTAVQPARAVANIVTNPVETVAGLTPGLGRFFDRVGAGAERVYDAATDSSRSASQRTVDVASAAGSMAGDALGYEKERRKLAQQLRVDPYTPNRELSALLDQFADVAFAGHVGMNTLIAAVVAAPLAVAGTNFSNDLVWETPRGDLIVRNAALLAGMQVPDSAIRALQQSPGVTLSMQTSLIVHLAALDGVAGRPDVVAFAGTAKDVDQGLFIVRAVRQLATHHKTQRLASIGARGTVFGREQSGALVVPGPVDLVSWSARLERFASRTDLEAPVRGLWISGRATPRARQELEARSWQVHENVAR